MSRSNDTIHPLYCVLFVPVYYETLHFKRDIDKSPHSEDGAWEGEGVHMTNVRGNWRPEKRRNFAEKMNAAHSGHSQIFKQI